MANITDRTAYLRGLAEGMKLDREVNEQRLILEMLDVMDEMSHQLADVNDSVDELNEYVEDIDNDLSDMENVLFGDDDCDCCDDDCDCCDDEDLYEIECPACHDTVYLDEDMLEEDGITCPNCGTELEFDFDGCDCGCCHGEDDTDADEKE